MTQARLDQELVRRGLVATRSQAENYIKLGQVKVNNVVITKSSQLVSSGDRVRLLAKEQYVSRAALKLASVARALKLNFDNKIVLDVGSSTGGFTDYVLRHGAKKVVAVDVGTNQLHPTLRTDPRIELHEQTDIRAWISDLRSQKDHSELQALRSEISIVLVDVSFISLREVLPYIAKLIGSQTQVVAMVKPQFEAGGRLKHKGVIKNDRIRREILGDFEAWAASVGRYVIHAKADSGVSGAKGNKERFYLLRHV